MRILQVIPYFVPAWGYGGPIPVCYELSKKLVENGHSVTVCTTDAYDNSSRIWNRKEKLDGINIIRFRNISNYLAWYHNLFIPVGFINFIKKNLKNYDVVHLHDYRTLQNAVISYYAYKYKIPYVLQPHGTTYIILKKYKLKKLFDKKFGYEIIKKANAILVLNETEAKNLEKMGAGKNKIKIVPNGIDVRKFNNLPPKGTFRNKYSIDKNEKLILYVGRIHKSKGIDTLLKSFAELLHILPTSKLVLVGPDDGYMEEMETIANKLKISGKVIFTGFVPHEEKVAAYVDADVFVTPSFSGFPVTFLEAMTVGLPIITTNKGDKLDWLDKKVGYVTNYSARDIANAIYSVLKDENLYKEFYKNAQNLIKEEFNWNKIVKKIEDIYQDSIEEMKQ